MRCHGAEAAVRVAASRTETETGSALGIDLCEEAVWEERPGTLHGAGLPRAGAELEAARITATLARNRRYTWATLRAALAGYPALLSQVPYRGAVDAMPLGLPTVAVREGQVARQGEFTGVAAPRRSSPLHHRFSGVAPAFNDKFARDRPPARPSDRAIRNRAKAKGWTRDLSDAVRSWVRGQAGEPEVAA